MVPSPTSYIHLGLGKTKHSMCHKSRHYGAFVWSHAQCFKVPDLFLPSRRPDGLRPTAPALQNWKPKTVSVEASARPGHAGIRWSSRPLGFPLQRRIPSQSHHASSVPPRVDFFSMCVDSGWLWEGWHSLHPCRSTCQRRACSQQIFFIPPPQLGELTEWCVGFPKASFIRKADSFDHPLSSQSRNS